MRCLRNKGKACSSTVITLEWEEYPACVRGRDYSFLPESLNILGAKGERFSGNGVIEPVIV